MSKVLWKPGTMLYPLPAVMVSCRDKDGRDNIITIAWAGTVCSDPPTVSISVRPERFSYGIIKESREFCINLTTKKTCRATDFCGVRSGKDIDKFEATGLTKGKCKVINCSSIEECPVNIECRVKQIVELGTHHMFIAEVVGVNVDEKLIDKNGRLRLDDADLMAYSHGRYYSLSKELGFFGYSVAKKKKVRRR